MLTPVFECSQEGGYVVVRLFLSAICKVMDAVFDIHDTQFTFYSSPYYLRLRFDQCLQEGKGERATYDLEANVLTVYLPKANASETFTKLDNPGYLIATEKQRAALIQVVGGDGAVLAADAEAEETEYVQSLHDAASAQLSSNADVAEQCSYGFANAFSGLFDKLDADVVREVLSLHENPERTTRAERRRLRIAAESADFDEDALLLAFEDAEGEVEQVLRYVPAHVSDFRAALSGGGGALKSEAGAPGASPAVYASIAEAGAARAADADALEEEETTLLASDDARPVTVWHGNIADFKRPLIEEINPDGSSVAATQPAPQTPGAAPASLSRVAAVGPRTRLAIPRVRPVLKLTRDETEVLLRLKTPRLLFPPVPAEVEALTADLLFSEAYDDLVTEGAGCSESLWNLTQLSPALSHLDAPDSLYDACVAFARRALVYPLHRHCALLQRVWAVVGTRLLLGRLYVVRALLRVRTILTHAEHKHLLATIYLDPLIAYWMNVADADERLTRLALELHQHVSRTEAVTVSATPAAASTSALHTLLDAKTVTLYPLALVFFGLPFAEESADDCEA